MSINVYELVTNRIIEQLENNIIPWEKPWSGTIDGAFNRVSKKPYSILNQMLLKYDNEYASFKQWKDLGGHIRKGEKSEIVVFWKMYPIKEKQDDGTDKRTEKEQLSRLVRKSIAKKNLSQRLEVLNL